MNHPKQIVELPITHPKIRDEDIVTFELRHNVKFPADYREFMLEYNGGNFTGNYFQSPSGIEFVIQKIYSLGEGGHRDLNVHYMQDDCPKAYANGIIVIGRDVGGGCLLLAMRGKESGTIYYLDDEELLRPSSGYVKIAESFSEFMDGLKPW